MGHLAKMEGTSSGPKSHQKYHPIQPRGISKKVRTPTLESWWFWHCRRLNHSFIYEGGGGQGDRKYSTRTHAGPAIRYLANVESWWFCRGTRSTLHVHTPSLPYGTSPMMPSTLGICRPGLPRMLKLRFIMLPFAMASSTERCARFEKI